jgi:riboflavin synthase
MFTGIIHHAGCVAEARRSGGALRLTVAAGPVAEDACIGDSICVNGVCLTVAEKAGELLSFDVTGETLSYTILGEIVQGDSVNLEPSLRPSDRMGGHFVTGHVDGIATLDSRRESPGQVRMSFKTDPELTRMMLFKGSIAVDGISLTLTDVREGSFAVTIIPHTLAVTTLRARQPGDRVNIEADLIGKWVMKTLGGERSGMTEDFLREHGFA